jgi:hypothetical protein
VEEAAAEEELNSNYREVVAAAEEEVVGVVEMIPYQVFRQRKVENTCELLETKCSQ